MNSLSEVREFVDIRLHMEPWLLHKAVASCAKKNLVKVALAHHTNQAVGQIVEIIGQLLLEGERSSAAH